MGCCFSVSESNIAIVERFGRFSHTASPGFNCLNMCTEKVAGELSFKIQQYNLDFNTRTKDNVFVTLKFAFMLKVAENAAELAVDAEGHAKPAGAPGQVRIGSNVTDEIIYRAFYNLKAPVTFITAEIEAYFRSHSMNYTMDEMFAARENLTKDICSELNRKLSPHGYVVRSVMVTDINPDHNVVKSMNDVVAAQKDRQAQIARAEAEKNAAILRAEGEARTRELEGAGIAAQRRRIVEGLQESVMNFKQALPNADPNHLLTTVLMTQYLDVLKEAATHGKNTFILPSSPAHIQAIEGQIGMALLGTAPANAQNVANARQAERQA